jgi:hypothetical protein
MSQSNQWVVRTNIFDFKRKLSEERDPQKRRILEMLIAQEEAKLDKDEASRAD